MTVKCAKAIRKELKQSFPGVKFSVRKRHYGVVVVKVVEGIANREKVWEVLGKYEYGEFDGMQDLYVFNNRREDIPQVRYVELY